mmetsp:Transcript_83692/g.269715  ORF Transcript_83692/g.269715 Transcript_83692/m.269715 type:complete len:482 (-) Transcript_83692:663-2108(-)
MTLHEAGHRLLELQAAGGLSDVVAEGLRHADGDHDIDARGRRVECVVAGAGGRQGPTQLYSNHAVGPGLLANLLHRHTSQLATHRVHAQLSLLDLDVVRAIQDNGVRLLRHRRSTECDAEPNARRTLDHDGGHVRIRVQAHFNLHGHHLGLEIQLTRNRGRRRVRAGRRCRRGSWCRSRSGSRCRCRRGIHCRRLRGRRCHRSRRCRGRRGCLRGHWRWRLRGGHRRGLRCGFRSGCRSGRHRCGRCRHRCRGGLVRRRGNIIQEHLGSNLGSQSWHARLRALFQLLVVKNLLELPEARFACKTGVPLWVDGDAVVHRPRHACVASLDIILTLDNISAGATWSRTLRDTPRVLEGLQLPKDDGTSQRVAEHRSPISHRRLLQGRELHRRGRDGLEALLAGSSTVALVARLGALCEFPSEQPILELLSRRQGGKTVVLVRIQHNAMIPGPCYRNRALRTWSWHHECLTRCALGLARALASAI